MKTFYIYQLKNDYIQLIETIEVERPTKEFADMIKDKYGDYIEDIYHGWEPETKNWVGNVHEKEYSSLRKVRTYIMKDKKL